MTASQIIHRIRRVRPCTAFVGSRGGFCRGCKWREHFHRPRFQQVNCSQCGAAFGPGNEGFSECRQHEGVQDVR